ncbi:MAG: hypothetical protein OEL83_12720 [Desulforhopalus sp.]|nr:hypothetical protein [Desulforhopalus sp.]
MANILIDMTIAGLKTVVIRRIFVPCLVVMTVFSLLSSSYSRELIVPEKSINLIDYEEELPQWKILWDKARNHVRAEQFRQAAAVYSELFTVKSNLEEANWEYCKILLKIGDYKNAKKIVIMLIEKKSNNIEYMYVCGQIAIHEKDWQSAAKYFGRVLEKDPTGALSAEALEGLANSMRSMGKIELSLPLSELLIVRQPESLSLQQEVALDANKLGQNDKTLKLLKRILPLKDVNDNILNQAIKLLDKPGDEKEGSVLLEQYLKRHPEYLPFRHKLSEYYLIKGDYEAALGHLGYLIEKMDNNDSFLKKAGAISLYKLGRPDRALIYFEKYFQKHPNDNETKNIIANIQHILANDFLSIVENDGAWLLWSDLAKVTSNRLAIYLQMAEMLEKKGMLKEYFEVLAIIHKHHPEDETIAMQLAQKYYEGKQYENALVYLDKVLKKDKRTKSYYLLRAKVELEMGRLIESLASSEAALQLDPGDAELCKSSIVLAGSLGEVGRMKILFENGLKVNKRQPSSEVFLAYLDQLSKNFLFREYEKVRKRYRMVFARDRKTLDKMDVQLTVSLRREGKARRAEQLLRQLLKDKRSVNEVLFLLAQNNLADKNLSNAQVWYSFIVKTSAPGKLEFSHDPDGCRRLLVKARILKADGEYEAADTLIGRFFAEISATQSKNELIPFIAELEKERCWLSYYLGDYKEALARLEKHSEFGVFDPEILTLRTILSRKVEKRKNEDTPIGDFIVGLKTKVNKRIEVIETDLEHQELDSAEHHINAALKYRPDSVVSNVLFAKLLIARGKFSEAKELFLKLLSSYPDESYFQKRLIEIEIRQGNYGNGLAYLENIKGGIQSADIIITELPLPAATEELLTLARILWGEKQHEKALQVYKKLLSPPVHELLIEKFRQKKINYLYLTRKKTLWNSVMMMLQSEPEVIAELMEPAFLVDNLENESGKIVADYYEMYSWQKMIATEYLARKAIFERNYYSAEQSYKKLLEEQGPTEGIIDLATVYSRIGKYRKEAQVYEAIQTTGATSTELKQSIERSTLQLSPQNIIDVAYLSKDGHNGFVDLASISSGTAFRFTPGLDKDVRLAYSHNRYEAINSPASTTSNLLYGSTIYEFTKDYEISFGGGAEKFDGGNGTNFLYKIEFKGQLDEYFHSFIGWEKSLVNDTVLALKEGITKQELGAGLYCETPLGLTFGVDFNHRSNSDDNTQNRFHGYSSYGLFGESVHLLFRYDYQFFENTNTNPSDLISVQDHEDEILLYWSPASFSENLFTLHFQHDFFGYQQDTKRGVSYYAIDNTIGYDDLETVTYTGKFDIFLEMNPHFLLKGNVTFVKSDLVEERGLSLSLHYRW